MSVGPVRLVAARPAPPWPALSAAQREVLAHRGPALLVLGAPGSGRTTTALALVADRLAGGADGSRVLLLAPTRLAAARLRDALTAHLPASSPPVVRTPAALAFAILRARAALDGEPAPVLLSGPEQDLELGELLAGHASGEVPGPDWGPRVPPEALGLRGFRDELRDLLMRAAERGLTPADLAHLGRRHERPEWVAAASVYAEYLDVLDLGAATPDRGRRHDPAAVVAVAADVLADWRAEEDGVTTPRRPRFSLVVVDDHQESTVATARLLSVLADDGAHLALFADPDAAVQGFRGAEPRLVARAGVEAATGEPGAFGARTLTLPEVWRHGPELRGVVGAVSQVVRGTERAHRVARPAPGRPPGEVAVRHLTSPAQEAAAVVLALRHAHLRGGVGWDEMAVIARAGGQVTALRRALAAAGVPVTVAGSDTALSAEPAVRPLLLALGCVTRQDPVDAEEAAALLLTPVGGLDSVGLRRLRRALRAQELTGGGGRASDALLVEAVSDPAHAALLPPTRHGPARVARVLAAGREAAARPGATALDVLWALWRATGLAATWREVALAGGPGGARADADLDAVLALFKAAERFVDRMPGAPAVAFLEHLGSQELPGDVLAAHGDAGPAVALLTPAGAAGREWDLVVVAGVQEGTWPDLRLRDSLLGAQELVDVVAGRGARTAGPAGHGEARAAVLDDEVRAFVAAVSRARRALLVTAVAGDDDQPSPLLDLLTPTPALDLLPAAFAPPAGEDLTLEVPAALDLRSVVAQARVLAERGDDGAARLLAALAEAGRTEADPATWYGVGAPSTAAPLHGPDEAVPLSPSKLQQLDDCALRWALEGAGGTPAATFDQSVGTLIHAIAADLPDAPTDELLAELERRWPTIDLGDGWDAERQHDRAVDAVRKLGAYLASADPAVGIEERFTARVGRAVLRGSADRVERTREDGEERLRVVDLKTGKSAIPVKEGETNLQLLAYQVAVEHGDLGGGGRRSAGARLVYVGTTTKSPTVRAQASLADPARRAAAEERIAVLVDAASGSHLVATRTPGCTTCPVRRSCPLQPEGRTLGVDRG